MSLSPEELHRRLDEGARDPAVTAHLDQQQAALDANRNNGIWWAALLVLSAYRDNESAKIMALHHMRLFLADLDAEEIAALVAYTLTDIMMRIAAVDHGGDVAATVAEMVGGQMMNFEKFIATGGASCPACGADKGWGDHSCVEE